MLLELSSMPKTENTVESKQLQQRFNDKFFYISVMLKSRNEPDKATSSAKSVAVSISEPSVVEDQHKWTIFMSKANLPAALNDPRLHRRETDFFTKTWGESFVEKTTVYQSPHLPQVTREHFRKYLKKTAWVTALR